MNLEEKKKNLFGPRAHLLLQFFLCYRASSRENTRDEEKKKKKIELFREKRETKGYDRRGLIRAKPVRVFTYVFSAAGNHAASRTGAAYKSELFSWAHARCLYHLFAWNLFTGLEWLNHQTPRVTLTSIDPDVFYLLFFYIPERLCLRNSAFVATFLKGDFLFSFTCPFE